MFNLCSAGYFNTLIKQFAMLKCLKLNLHRTDLQHVVTLNHEAFSERKEKRQKQ